MQTAFAPLPELPGVRHQPVAAPMRRARRLQQKAGCVLGRIGHQRATACDHLALRRGPGANARIQGAAGVVAVGLLCADLFHHTLDAHHALELDPVKLQRGKRIARQLPPLAALVIGEPDDATRVIAFDQHHAGGGAQIAAHGGQRHGVGLGQLGAQCLVHPLRKLRVRVGVGGVLIQFGAFVTFPQVRDSAHAPSIGMPGAVGALVTPA